MTALSPIAPRRGRILASLYHRPAAAAAGETRGAGALWILLAILPLFGQTFQYVLDVPAFYFLSKFWPLLTLPLAILGMAALEMPFKALLLFSYTWLYGVSPIVSVLELGNSFGGAVATTIKIWSLTTVFGLAYLLAMLKPSRAQLTVAIVSLGVLTFVMLAALFWLVPFSVYSESITETKLFLYDLDRGKRVYIPMYFGFMAIFVANRSFWDRPRLWKAAAIVVAFYLLSTMYKQRTSIVSAGLVMVLGAVLNMKRGRIMGLIMLGVVAAYAAIPLFSYLTSKELGVSLGGSLSVRQLEFAAATDFLNAKPWRWFVGVGSITRGGDFTLANVVGANAFYLADLGWLGVAFEYGLVGAALLLLLHLAGLYVTARAADRADPITRALMDYVIFILLSSSVYSVVYAPGELMTCMGLAYYYRTTFNPQRRAAATAPGSAPAP
jgi:hypothetical protein